MNRIILPAMILLGSIFFQGCALQEHATVIEPDKNNACIQRMIIQVGIDGTDADVVSVRDQLEPCFAKECFIPCAGDNSKGCKVLTNVIVKKWSDLNADEQKKFHHITMIDNDGQPSNAYIGGANGEPSHGTWRRNEGPRTYCHETLHLCGLKDQYCSRIFNTVDSTITTEITCKPDDDPNGGSCCTPTAQYIRCSSPCAGHEHDLMATLTPELSCDNILDVLKKAGFDKCPEACCSTSHTYQGPSSTIILNGAYLHFGDKDVKINAYGISGSYTKTVSPSIGITLDGGYYMNTKKDDFFKDNNNILSIMAGITYFPIKTTTDQKYVFSTHALFGLMNLMQKTSLISGGYSASNNQSSFAANIGAAIDWKLGQHYSLRLPELDYMPSFMAHTTQNNFRINVGVGYRFSGRKQ